MRARLRVVPRAPMTKGQIKKLRAQGYVPVSLSGRGVSTRHYSAPSKDLQEILRKGGQAALIEVLVDGEDGAVLAMPRQVERDPITHGLLQVGLMRVSAQQPIIANVPVVLVGQPGAAKSGHGVLEHERDTLEVRGLPEKLPTHVDVDVSGMELGDALHVRDVPIPPDCEILTAPDEIIAVLHPVRVHEAAAEEAADTGAAEASTSRTEE
ncbi:MAG: 50S ribosomal protein L25 [Chthonomonadales bacterium]